MNLHYDHPVRLPALWAALLAMLTCTSTHAQVDVTTIPRNIALDGTATTNGNLWSAGWSPSFLIDGNAGNPIHGDGAGGVTGLAEAPGFSYTIDLGSVSAIDSISLLPRQDGCCPDRLMDFRVGVHADAGDGSIGAETWGVDLFPDADAPAGPGSSIDLVAGDGVGTFEGRFVKVTTNQDPVQEYELQLNEVQVFSGVIETPINYALGATATLNGQFTWPGFPESNIVDGDRGTLSHGGGTEDGAGGAAYNTPVSWVVELDEAINFDHINVVNRGDGCCPDRLTNFRVSIHDDANGEIGSEVWGADLRTDMSDSGVGGVDVITADLDADGQFAGKWLQISLLDGAPDNYHLQIAEVEAFGTLVPEPTSSVLVGMSLLLFPMLRRKLPNV